jgi:type IV pilus assembly protein PilA
MRRGFTMIELLIVLGILGILAVIVLVAINPNKQLCDARRAKRQSDERQVMNGLQQYLLKNLTPVANDEIVAGEENAKPICKYQFVPDVDNPCVSLDALVPTYVADMPQDSEETNTNYTGYKIYKDLFGRQIVNSDRDSTVCSNEESSS